MKLSNNFYLHEFSSKDGAEMPQDVFFNIQKLALQLQIVRDIVKKPITINSGYRSPEHNKKIGGVPNSQHVLGKAADIVIKGQNSKKTYELLEKLIDEGRILQGGLGLYKNFVHYDIRKKRARWDYS